MIRNLLLLLSILLTPCVAHAADYYAAASGGGGTTCSSESPCTLAYLNGHIAAGDKAILKDGTYNTPVMPTNSGSAGNVIEYVKDTGATVNITACGAGYPCLFLDGKDYIKVNGIRFYDPTGTATIMNIRNGADYNEVTDCTFYSTSTTTHNAIVIWGQCTGGSPYTCPSTHNWFHGNTVYNMGYINAECDDVGNNMYVGSATANDGTSNYTTIEDNVFYGGAHGIAEIYTKYNVIRNNVLHNEGYLTDPGTCTYGASARNAKYGNRGIQLYEGHDDTATYDLLESNRIGHSAFASDGGMDGNIVITSKNNIVRYNDSYYSLRWNLHHF